jgi:hypothetical protein
VIAGDTLVFWTTLATDRNSQVYPSEDRYMELMLWLGRAESAFYGGFPICCFPDGCGPFVQNCCEGRVGDANKLGGDEPTIGDVSAVIDALFISGTCENVICISEADTNQSGGATPICDDITIGDVSILIDYLFITGPSLVLPDCL